MSRHRGTRTITGKKYYNVKTREEGFNNDEALSTFMITATNKLSLIKKLSIKLKASENVVKSKMSNYLDDVENGVADKDEEICMYNHCCRATLSTNGSTWRMYCNYPDRYRRI